MLKFTSTALCSSLPEQTDGLVPEWIEIFQGSQVVSGRDGRTWTKDNEAILSAFNRAAPLPLDWEHAQELKAPKGEEAPAAGWIEKLEAREDGSIWGRVSWTERGKASVSSREYRFLSPAFLFTKQRKISALTSVGLVGRPNLDIAALNSTKHIEHKDSQQMDKVTSALGLVSGANEDQIVSAISDLQTKHQTALNSAQTPDLEKFVPRADYDALQEKALNSQNALKQIKTDDHQKQVDEAIDAAKAAGKITPATEDYYRSTCATEDGLGLFKAFCAKAPEIAGKSNLNNENLKDGQKLSDEQKAICSRMGVTEEDFLKSLKEEN